MNGFWGLLVIDAEYDEWWTSVNAVDEDGRVLLHLRPVGLDKTPVGESIGRTTCL